MTTAGHDAHGTAKAGEGASVVVRRAIAAELPVVGELTLTAYVTDGFVTADADYVGQLRDASTRDRDAEVWVAVDGNTNGDASTDSGRRAVLGSVTFCPVGSPYREIAVDDREAEFRMLAVASAARRRGVGRLLAQRCVDRARELGQTRMVMCSDRRMAAAHALYRSLGYYRLPERDWSPVEGVDLLAFALDL